MRLSLSWTQRSLLLALIGGLFIASCGPDDDPPGGYDGGTDGGDVFVDGGP